MIKKSCLVSTVLTLIPLLFITAGSVHAQESGSSATLILSPASGDIGLDTTFDVGLYLNTFGAQVDGVDAQIIYEPGKLEAQSVDTNLQVFSSYPTKSIDSTTGRITVIGNAPANSPYSNTTPTRVATITFRTLSETSTTLKIDFTPGATTDSNVIENSTNIDILSSVTDARFNISPTATGSAPDPGTDLPEGATVTPTLILLGGAAALLGLGVLSLRLK